MTKLSVIKDKTKATSPLATNQTLTKFIVIISTNPKKIITARREFALNFENLKKLGVVLKRAQYFITCKGKYFYQASKMNQNFIETNLLSLERNLIPSQKFEQISLFDSLLPTKEDKVKCLTGSL